jgi:plasmid stabilization system protein ParE
MRLRWTDPAARDLTQICDYIGERGSPVVARRILRGAQNWP